MNRLVLAIDVGNTRTKWGLNDQVRWVKLGTFDNNQPLNIAGAWDAVETPARIIGSNVASQMLADEIGGYWHHRGSEIRWIRSGLRACGVSNGYDKPEQLGTDRWAGLVAAWNRSHCACLVVSAGTAMTIDMLDNHGKFLGGQIIPGRGLMLRSLVSGTAALKETNGQRRDCPRNTADAMVSGVDNALRSAVTSAFRQLEKMTKTQPACLVTGGDAENLVQNLEIECEFEPILVLEGLLKLAVEEDQS